MENTAIKRYYRMNIKNGMVIMTALFLASCSSINQIKMSTNPMVNKIISDYCKHNKDYINNYSVFHIDRKQIARDDIEIYTVIPENDEIAFKIYLDDSLNYKLPTHYLEYKKKLFIWKEKGVTTTDSVMQFLYKRNLVDSSYVKFQMGLITENEVVGHRVNIDDEIVGVSYIFCKSTPFKIKKKIKSTKYIYPYDERLNVKCD